MNFNHPKKEETLKRKKPEPEPEGKNKGKKAETQADKGQVEVSFKPEEKKTHAQQVQEKMEKTMQKIEKLATSDDVVKARDELMFKEAPTNFYQYERDFKIFKTDTDKKAKYLLNIGAENVKSIFKSDLEADVLLDMFNVFLTQDDQFFKDHQSHITSIVEAIQKVEPFGMCCEFLMDEEKEVIKNLVEKIEKVEGHDDLSGIKNKFKKVADIAF